MKAFNQIVYTTLVFLTGITTVEGQVQVLPLDSVLALVNKNPALLEYDAKAGAENAYAAGAKNLDALKISAGQYQAPYQLNPNAGSFMISAEQMFINPAKLRAKENYMKAVSKVTDYDKRYLKNQLIAQARQLYDERVVLEKKLALLRNTQSLLEYMIKDATIRLTYGKEKLSNIYKAKAGLYELDNAREQFNNSVNQNNIMLNTLMYRNKQAAFFADTNYIIKDYETQATDTTALAAHRSDIGSIKQNIELQQLNAQMEYAKRKPDFGLQASHMFSYGGYPNQYILMASVTIPVAPWASREYKANLKGVRYEKEALEQKKNDLLNQAEGQLASLRAGIASQKKQLKNYGQNIIPALQSAYKTALLAYDQNTGDLPSVLESINDLQSARMAYLDRLQELLNLQVAYEKENEKY